MATSRLRLTRPVVVLLFAVLSAALFVLDISTPPGVADGIGYAPVLVICLWIGGRNAILSGAALLTLLTLVGAAFVGHGGIGHLSLVNRVIGLVSIWVMAAVLIYRAQVERETIDAAERAKRDAEEKQHLLSAMNHALRTPLNAIVGFSEVLALDPTLMADSSANESLTAVHVSALQLLEQINDFLEFSRLEAGQLQVYLEPVELRAAVTDAVSLGDFLAKQAGIEILVELPATLPLVEADARLATQCVGNLLNNALKFTGPGGRITISARLAGDCVILAIADTGIGIAPEDLPRLARPFVQLRQAGAFTRPGTGLGLALTKTFMELQGGTFGIESVLAAGTTVSLSFGLPPNP